MDEDSNLDYEMEPQAAYAGLHPSAEEAMEDLSSEGMAMSDVHLRSEATDKTGIDVDFDDSTVREPTPVYVFETEEISEIIPATTEGSIHLAAAQRVDSDAAQALQNATTSVDQLVATESSTAAIDAVIEGDGGHIGAAHEEEASQEVDELHEEEGDSTAQNGYSYVTQSVEADQLVGEVSKETVQPNGEEREDASGTNIRAQYDGEDFQDAAIRVSFHGQDFVMWSTAEIPSFLAVAVPVDAVNASDESEEVVLQVEAPALDISKDVLWQPLDNLFTGLREKKALGDFLDESHELNISFPDLDLDVAEDNLYCRELTLDDLLQLHHGLGLLTSLHIQVSERPRFITKYNELAQHIASLIGNQLQHSSDEEEEAANSARPSSHPTKTADTLVDEAALETSGLQASHETTGLAEPEGANSAQSPMRATPENGDTEPYNSDVKGTAAVAAGDPASHSGVQASLTARTIDDPKAEQQQPIEHSDAQEAFAKHELDARGYDEPQAAGEEEEEAVDQLEGEQDDGVDQAQEQGGAYEQAEAEVDGADPSTAATDRDAALAAEAKGQQTHPQGFTGGQEDVDSGDEAEEEEEVEGEWDEQDEEEYVQEYEDEVAEEEGEEEEYAGETEINGEDAEQTFYTSVNDSSEAEEDELEDTDQGTASAFDSTQPVDDPDFVPATEAYNDDHEWQGESEDQIVEYVEEPSAAPLAAVSPASTASTLYQTGAQRKRSLEDENDNAEYEQDDFEAESKRVKVE